MTLNTSLLYISTACEYGNCKRRITLNACS